MALLGTPFSRGTRATGRQIRLAARFLRDNSKRKRRSAGVDLKGTLGTWIRPSSTARRLVLLCALKGCWACCAPLGVDLRCRSTTSRRAFPAAWKDMSWLCLLNDAFNSAELKMLTDTAWIEYFDTYGERLGKEEGDARRFRRGIFKEDAEEEAVGNWYA